MAALVLAFIIALFSCVAMAEVAELELTGHVARQDVFAGHVVALRDPDGTMTLEQAREADFVPVGRDSVDFGYTSDAVWLHLRVVNATEDVRDWRLHFRSNFLPEFAVWMVDDTGRATLLEDQRPDSPFHARALPYPELVVPFQLAPGEAGALFVRYTSGGSSELSFTIRTAEEFLALAATQTARNFVFYGMMILLSGASLLAAVFMRLAIFAAYCCYACVAMLFVMHADGNTFQYLWPQSPTFNAWASVPLGAGLIFFGSFFARMFLRTREFHPVLNVMLIGLMVVAVALMAVTAIGGTQTIKRLLILIAFLSTVLFTVAGLVAARTRFREVRFYVIAWLGAVFASTVMTGRHWLGIDISEEFQFNAMRIVMVSDAVMMGLAILDRLNQMKQAQQRALEISLGEARRNLELSERLRQLEADHSRLLERAEANRERLADAAHDLRQPLAALRLNVRRLLHGADGVPPPRRSDFDTSFDQLERLVAGELERQDAAGHAAPDPSSAGLPVGEVLEPVAEMFVPTAAARGLALRHVCSDARTALPPMVLMRIASNLVSNAIKYTAKGRVLMGVRRRAGGLWLEVHDTGPGLSPAEFEQARARTVRLDTGPQSEGAGLGLAIVDRLAREHGLAVQLAPGRSTGTGIAVALPTPAGRKERIR